MIQIQLLKFKDDSVETVSMEIFTKDADIIKYVTHILHSISACNINSDKLNILSQDSIDELNESRHDAYMRITQDTIDKLSNSNTEERLNISTNSNGPLISIIFKYLGDISDSKDIPLCWSSENELIDVFPIHHKELLEEFTKYITHIEEHEDCVDSFRIGLKNNIDSMNQYDKIKSCCGQDDSTISIDGVEYMFGCNYGH